MRKKRYSKDMKGTQEEQITTKRLLLLKENLLFNKTKNNEIQQRGNKESVDL